MPKKSMLKMGNTAGEGGLGGLEFSRGPTSSLDRGKKEKAFSNLPKKGALFIGKGKKGKFRD